MSNSKKLDYDYVDGYVAPRKSREGRGMRVRRTPALTLSDRTSALVRGLLIILQMHGASEKVTREMEIQIHSYLDNLENEKVWLKHAKHMLCFPLSDYLRNERPKSPGTVFEPTGVFRRWWRNRIHVFSVKNTHLWYSWFQAKRCSAPVSEEFVRATYVEHLAKLSKEDDGDLESIEKIFSDKTFKKVLERVRTSVNSNLRIDNDWGTSKKFTDYSASSSACFEATRSMGGQHKCLLDLAEMGENLDDELVRMDFHPVVYGRKRLYNKVVETRRISGFESWRDLEEKALNYHKNLLKCEIQAVLEPMKVRVISKGEALPYYTCRPLQKVMHSCLREMPCFRLIGKPLCPTDIVDLTECARADWKWLSVDYSAATDGLSWRYSGRILRYIIQDLPTSLQERALQVLGPHELFYPVDKDEDREDGVPCDVFTDSEGVEQYVPKKREHLGTQRNGQLMGSILSFPILCLANLGVYLSVNKDLHYHWSDEQRLKHVLVNGDDMVYAAPAEMFKQHSDLAGRVGLEMSVGKAYVHDTYLNVNSTSIHCDLKALQTKKCCPWQIDYLNVGLFFGTRKVQSSDKKTCRKNEGEEEVSDLESVVNEYNKTQHAAAHLSSDPTRGFVTNIPQILKGALPGKQVATLKLYLSMNKMEIAKECLMKTTNGSREHIHTRNIFLPVSSGGMGVVAPPGFRFKTTMFDRYLAYLMRTMVDMDVILGDHSPIHSTTLVRRDKQIVRIASEGYPVRCIKYESVPWAKVKADLTVYTVERARAIAPHLHPRKAEIGFQWVSPNKQHCTIL